jgi:hypothetical protein
MNDISGVAADILRAALAAGDLTREDLDAAAREGSLLAAALLAEWDPTP